MKTRMVSSATSFQRLQTSLQSPMPRLPRSNVYSTRDPANPSASVHRKRFFTPSLTLNISMRWLLESGLSIITRNWRNLLLVLANLPFALVGGVLAVFATGGVLSLGGMVGFITLLGITLRNSILMIARYERLVEVEGW